MLAGFAILIACGLILAALWLAFKNAPYGEEIEGVGYRSTERGKSSPTRAETAGAGEHGAGPGALSDRPPFHSTEVSDA